MNNMNEEHIKKIIKQTVKEPEIKLTARQIYAQYEMQKQTAPKRKSIFSFPRVRFALSFAVTIFVVGGLLYVNNLNRTPIDLTETFIVRDPAKVQGGKEGEFVFMTFSAATYGQSESLTPSPMRPNAKQGGNQEGNGQTDIATLEGVLDKTMPLVADFYAVDNGFEYEKNQGTFIGTHGTYTHEYIVNDTTRILGNVSFEEDDDEVETEIEGEIIIGDEVYLYEGESEIDLADNEIDISMKIIYSEDLYLEISSENEDNKQEFEYKLVENEHEVFTLKIETFRHGQQNKFYTDTRVVVDGKQYRFVIEKQINTYIILYKQMTITAVLGSNNKYIYTY